MAPRTLETYQNLLQNHSYSINIIANHVARTRSWFRGVPLSTNSFPLPFHPLIPLIHEQNTVGWYGFLRGFTSKLWGHHQHQHLEHNKLIKKTVTGSLWLVSLLSRIWDHIFVLWDHYKATLHGATPAEQALILTRTYSLHIPALHN
jgi:hypothetical protein